jgi:hypothetical protein
MSSGRPVLLGLCAGLVLIACAESATDPAAGDPGTQIAQARSASAPAAKNFVAPLDPGQETADVDSNATGLAKFQLSADGSELSYKLNVGNIQNVLMAHIHMAPAGVDGGVVVWLYPSAPPPSLIPGRSSGGLAEGVITDDDVTGDLAGQGLAGLLAAITAGNTYVNVHTSQYGAGEIRGQIKVAGPK